jgi:hypothetical protein
MKHPGQEIEAAIARGLNIVRLDDHAAAIQRERRSSIHRRLGRSNASMRFLLVSLKASSGTR